MDEGLIYEILSVVEEIPVGKVATYGQVARLIGREKNARPSGPRLARAGRPSHRRGGILQIPGPCGPENLFVGGLTLRKSSKKHPRRTPFPFLHGCFIPFPSARPCRGRTRRAERPSIIRYIPGRKQRPAAASAGIRLYG